MRITSMQMYDTLLKGVNKQTKIQADTTEQVSSGLRFQRPSQAGLDYKISLDLRHAQKGMQGSLTAIKTAESRLGSSQTMLNDMKNIMVRVQTLAVQQGSGNVGAAERQSATVEVKHLLTQFANDANQKWQGQSLFAGTAVDKSAFTQDVITGNYTYTGSAQDRTVAISDIHQVKSNVRGDDARFTAAFTALQSFVTALTANNQAGVQTALGDLNTASNGMIDLTSEVGGRISALTVSKTSYTDMKFNLDKQLNQHEAADIPAAVAKLQQSRIALQVSYSQISQLKSLSLINYLK
ncbi:MAG: flagellin [Mariprofundaceae bacterium]|nr:flagellin [Mariprofundaceae bacterium]